MTTNAITVSLNEIHAKSPCVDGWRTVLAAKGPDMEAQFPLADIIETNDFDDALWVLRCRPEYNNLWRKYAVWCARQVGHLVTDERSVAALDVAWRHSDGLATDQELGAARDAARSAARSASDAALSAALAAVWAAARDAARSVARSAASDAVWAAAWYTASDAARDAAWDAARDAQKQKLIEILNAGEWV